MLKSYNFWIRLIAVLLLLGRVVGVKFGLEIDSGLIIDLITAIASILVVLGVIKVPDSGKNKNGGFMEISDKIKTDIILAKAKLFEMFGVNDNSLVVSKILDDAIGGDNAGEVIGATNKTSEEESVKNNSEETEGEAVDAKTNIDGAIAGACVSESDGNSGDVIIYNDINKTINKTSNEGGEEHCVASQAGIEDETVTNNELNDTGSVCLEEDNSCEAGATIINDEKELSEFIGADEKNTVEFVSTERANTSEINLDSELENKLKLILKDKLHELIDTQFDQIIAENF